MTIFPFRNESRIDGRGATNNKAIGWRNKHCTESYCGDVQEAYIEVTSQESSVQPSGLYLSIATNQRFAEAIFQPHLQIKCLGATAENRRHISKGKFRAPSSSSGYNCSKEKGNRYIQLEQLQRVTSTSSQAVWKMHCRGRWLSGAFLSKKKLYR